MKECFGGDTLNIIITIIIIIIIIASYERENKRTLEDNREKILLQHKSPPQSPEHRAPSEETKSA